MKFDTTKKDKIDEIKENARKLFYLNTFIQIVDNTKAIIENCKHIVECNDIMVKIQTADYEVTVWGNNLTINDYNSNYVVINGHISSVEICQRRRGKTK